MDKKTQILKTTIALIAEKGIQDTPVSLIARKTGVSVGTIYHYFKSKEEIINQVYSYIKINMGTALSDNIPDDGIYKDKFIKYWENLYFHYINNTEEFIFSEQFAHSSFISPIIKKENEIHYYKVIQFLEEGVKTDKLKPINTEVLTAFVYGSIISAVKIALNNSTKLSPQEIMQIIELCWDGIKK